MIFHRRWTERVIAYHEGDLRRAERAVVEAHLGTCPPCGELLRKLAETDALLMGSRPAAEPLPSQRSQLILAQALARSGAARQVGRRTFGMWTFAASAVCLIAAGTAGVYRPPSAPGQPPAPRLASGSVAATLQPVEESGKPLRLVKSDDAVPAYRRPRRRNQVRRLKAHREAPPLPDALPATVADEGVRALAATALGYPGDHRLPVTLLVKEDAAPPELALEVKELPEDAPGQACASSALQDTYGRVTQKEVRVSTSLTEPQVILTGQAPGPSPTN